MLYRQVLGAFSAIMTLATCQEGPAAVHSQALPPSADQIV